MTPDAGAKAIRVLLVDDHRSVLWGLQKLVESARPRMEVVGTATCRVQALELAAAQDPDVVLVDLDLGTDSGLALIPELLHACRARMIVLTGLRDGDVREHAVMAGARGVLHKSEPAESILRAIEEVHGGELCLDRATVARMFATISANGRPKEAKAPHSDLTSTEFKVVAEVVRHKSSPNKVIADSLHISSHTLRNHLASIYDKLSIHHRLDLVLYAIDNGLDRPRA